tara:strand:+ start:2116 stop:2478 length:363 start_codon:yes stop_codon:yes gene_type:complete
LCAAIWVKVLEAQTLLAFRLLPLQVEPLTLPSNASASRSMPQLKVTTPIGDCQIHARSLRSAPGAVDQWQANMRPLPSKSEEQGASKQNGELPSCQPLFVAPMAEDECLVAQLMLPAHLF